MANRPTQAEMESNIMAGKTGLVAHNSMDRKLVLKRAKTEGGVKNKIKTYLKKTGQIK